MIDGLLDNPTSLWNLAWGNPWPRHVGKVSRAGDDLPMLSDDDDGVDAPRPPSELEYVCLHNIKAVVEACGGSAESVQDVLVVRQDYELLREMMEEGHLKASNSMVVAGQPGIGKTVFLVYLLLYRLERRLPTAIHLRGDEFFIFHADGARAEPAGGSLIMPREYWALTDSNDELTRPCSVFMRSRARVIQASNPRPDRWKDWIKQRMGQIVIADLPHPLEIGAIVQELGLDTARAYDLVGTWGPSIRMVLVTLLAPAGLRPPPEALLAVAAQNAAEAICANPSGYNYPTVRTPNSVGSAMLFVCPLRSHYRDVTNPQFAFTYIPTSHLSDIFRGYQQKLPNGQALDLYNCLSSHALTRTGAGWLHEKRVHVHLCSTSPPLGIFGVRGMQSEMRPSPQLLCGPLSSLTRCGAYASFYWLPSVANFVGIDGVLADSANVYAVQATIAGEHRSSPAAALRKVWDNVDRNIREKRAWHVVFVTDTEELAQEYVRECTDELEGFTLGQAKIGVQVWGCVLPSE